MIAAVEMIKKVNTNFNKSNIENSKILTLKLLQVNRFLFFFIISQIKTVYISGRQLGIAEKKISHGCSNIIIRKTRVIPRPKHSSFIHKSLYLIYMYCLIFICFYLKHEFRLLHKYIYRSVFSKFILVIP